MIYLDNAATTKMSEIALEEMKKMMEMQYANPSALYEFSMQNKSLLEHARYQIAKTLNVSTEEIFFTSGGSEADNWALRGIAEQYAYKGKHIITSRIEHKAVLNTCEYLQKHGFQVTYIDVDKEGRIDLEQLEKEMRPDTILVSIMYANNEIGTIMDVTKIASIAHKFGAFFHTDAVQAYGHENINCREAEIDLLSASGHKFHGPKGVGFLYKKKDIQIVPLIYGGNQERGVRGGTENTYAICAMASAAGEAYENREKNERYIRNLRNMLMDELLNCFPDAWVNGTVTNRLSNNINLTIPDVESLKLVDLLGESGICISTGSACNMRETRASHVLTTIGLSTKDANSSIRITLSRYTKKEEIIVFIEKIKEAVNLLKMIY